MIFVDNISKDLGEFYMKNVSLEIHANEYFVILGPTGAGKSILLETIAGIFMPDRGKIYLDETDITVLPSRKRQVGMVYQDYSLFPYLNVRDNIGFGLKNKDMDKESIKDKVDELLDFLKIHHLAHRYPGTLSGGEQQKVAIARAIAMEPKVLLLDEPLSALDFRTKTYLQEGLKKVKETYGITMVHVTHDQTEAMMLADRIAVMMHGELIQVGTPKEIFNRPKNEEIASFVGIENILRGQISSNNNGVAEVAVEGENTVLAVTDYNDGPVKVFIRPEDVILSIGVCESSVQNTFSGKVTHIHDMGALTRVRLDNDIVSLVTKRSLESLQLCIGTQVHASFKTTAAHVVQG